MHTKHLAFFIMALDSIFSKTTIVSMASKPFI